MIEPNSLSLLRTRIALGEIILFTGAGFSSDAKAKDGHALPDSQELRRTLWPIAFPGVPVDEESSLADIFECAAVQSSRRLQETLESCLRVDHKSLPDFYSTWLSIPWTRAYTLNIDDLEIAAARSFDLPRRIRTVSGSEPVPSSTDELIIVHLNGQLDDLPNVTFSAPQYARRLPGRDPWYSALAADLMSRVVVFVGTTLDEPPLWQHLELRGPKGKGRELRPRSFLITPHLSLARQQMLRTFNIEHIAMDAKQFAELVLAEVDQEVVAGLQRLSTGHQRQGSGVVIRSVSELRQRDQDINRKQYLLGREPTFRDVYDGFAIQRSFEDEILADTSRLQSRITLVTGTACTGKSTTLRRLALSLDADGKSVGWFDPTTAEAGIPSIREAIRTSDCDYIVIDDIDIFAAQAGPLLQELAETMNAPKVIAAARSTRAEKLKFRDTLETVDCDFIVAPPLTDADIDSIIDSLSSAGLLGRLAGMTHEDRRNVLRGLAGRQLLVAMIEATSGRSFHAKIDDECSQLSPQQRFLYAICALATRVRIGLSIDEILAAAGETTTDQLSDIDSLERQYLLVRKSDRRLSVRHRIVADRVVSWLRQQGQLAQPVEGLLFAMAIQQLRERNPSSRPFRLMVRLLNHQFMIEEIVNISDIRMIYESVLSVLSDDFHYWLQRGSLELEVGDLDLAENYLNQSRGLAPEDHRVRTAWSYMSLRRAAELAQNGEAGWQKKAQEAIVELKDIIEIRGATDAHAFHILGSQGLHYARRAPLLSDEKLRLLDDLRGIVKRGVRLHVSSDELKQLRDDLEAEYLNLAVPLDEDKSRRVGVD